MLIITPIFINFYDTYSSINSQKKYEKRNSVSKEFINSISKVKIKNPIGVSIKKSYKESSLFDKINPAYNFGYQFLCYTDNAKETIDIGIFDIQHDDKKTSDKKHIENYISNNLFYIFCKKNNIKSDKIVDAQLRFIKKMNCSFLITSKEIIIPKKIKNIINLELIDSKTGIRFYKLDY